MLVCLAESFQTQLLIYRKILKKHWRILQKNHVFLSCLWWDSGHNKYCPTSCVCLWNNCRVWYTRRTIVTRRYAWHYYRQGLVQETSFIDRKTKSWHLKSQVALLQMELQPWLGWQKSSGFATDGAPAVVGLAKGVSCVCQERTEAPLSRS